jgi:hypothetical protein
MSIQEANLSDLTRRFFEETSAASGAKLLDEVRGSQDLFELLRSHLLQPITDTEVPQRDAIDDLLAFYSILEIASMCHGISPELPAELAASAADHLSLPAMRRYYEKLYPLLLPRLFLQRLMGNAVLAEPEFPYDYLRQFLEITEMLSDAEVQMFLWFLDDGSAPDEEGNQYGLQDFLLTLSDGRKFAKIIAVAPENRTPLHQSLHGFVQFLEFCRLFDGLLQGLTDSPIFQSALWHFHGYWFQQLSGQVFGVISTAIEQYRNWVPKEGKDEQEIRAIAATHRSMDRAQLAMQRLTSAGYRHLLEAMFYSAEQRRLTEKIEMVTGDIIVDEIQIWRTDPRSRPLGA